MKKTGACRGIETRTYNQQVTKIKNQTFAFLIWRGFSFYFVIAIFFFLGNRVSFSCWLQSSGIQDGLLSSAVQWQPFTCTEYFLLWSRAERGLPSVSSPVVRLLSTDRLILPLSDHSHQAWEQQEGNWELGFLVHGCWSHLKGLPTRSIP